MSAQKDILISANSLASGAFEVNNVFIHYT